MNLQGCIKLPEMDGVEINPGIWLIGEPIPRPDLGNNIMTCLANIDGCLCVVELSIGFIIPESSIKN